MNKEGLAVIDVYSQFGDNTILQLIVQESNSNADKKNKKGCTRHSRINSCKPITANGSLVFRENCSSDAR